MADYDALTIKNFRLSDVSTDGQHAVFVCELADGSNFNFAVPEKELMPLMALASSASSQVQKIQKAHPDARRVLPVERWNVGEMPNTENVVLSFRMPGGMELSFMLHRSAADRMQETLRTMLGRAPEAPASGKAN